MAGLVLEIARATRGEGDLALWIGLAEGPCHGPDLKGIGDIPGIVGRSPMYACRQLNDVKNGTRFDPDVVPMQAVVAGLTQGDMLVL